MNVEFEIKKQIIIDAMSFDEGIKMPPDEDVIEYYDENKRDLDGLIDAAEDFRQSGLDTNLECKQFSRHYESDQVARKLDSGVWVSWTYWHGGGKHGEPEAIDWIPQAFEVGCHEEEVISIKRTFTIK